MDDTQAIAKKQTGRPSLFTEAIGQEICQRLAEGVLLHVVAAEVGVRPETIRDWAERYPSFATLYTRAEQIGFDRLAERLLRIPKEDGDVQRQRLESDNIKWFLSKRAARVYGDRLDVNVTQTVDIAGALSEARGRVLRPISDQQQTLEAETVEFTEVAAGRPTDTQSVPAPGEPEKGSQG